MHRIYIYSLFCLTFSTLTYAIPLPEHQTQLPSFQTAQDALKRVQGQSTTPTAKNVIFFIGDGMGVSTITSARIWQGQHKKNKILGEEHQLSFEKFPYSGLIKTYSTSAQTPDSASTMTAMSTGVKTVSGMLSITPALARGTCSLKNQKLLSLLDYAKHKDKAVGIISTARITHATPAALYAKVSERNWEFDGKIPEACKNQVVDIARQLVEHEQTIDVVLGGGAWSFVPAENPYNIEGLRTDARDLIQTWRTRNGPRGQFVQTQQELAAVTPENTQTLLGLFSNSHMAYEADRAKTSEPSLTEMTTKAIDLLSTNENGFFLMAEAGRIDHAHHAGNAARAIADTDALAQAVDATVTRLQEKGLLDDTLIIVTADHSHVVTFSGQSIRGTSVLGLITNTEGAPKKGQDNMPYTAINYTNGPGAKIRKDNPKERRNLSDVDTTDIEFMQPALIRNDKSETHAGEDVAIYARGPGAHLFSGNMEQNAIFHAINKTARLDAKPYVPNTQR